MKKHTLSSKETELIKAVRNTLMKGHSPSVRELMEELGYKSPRSTAELIKKLAAKGYVRRNAEGGLQIIENFSGDESRVQTVEVPLVGQVACGSPILAEENIEQMIPVSTRIASPPYRYYMLRAKGDSMNLAGINDGDAVLVRQQGTARNKEIVVALIDDEATIKEFNKSGDMVLLKPKSSNLKHKPIILTNDFMIQGIVVTTIPGL
ncbi:MAG: repressor LexA [Candidatus Goldiibacteriota bacterium HGW-Goldbacteria-1]|jgi:repressor LexA|nr:MAG: repressor LexA [Candidatus Goldiibacteriota bacterium HGW-Goldbacteria-1]